MRIQSDQQAMYVAQDFSKARKLPTWITKHHHVYPSLELRNVKEASNAAVAALRGEVTPHIPMDRLSLQPDEQGKCYLHRLAQPVASLRTISCGSRYCNE